MTIKITILNILLLLWGCDLLGLGGSSSGGSNNDSQGNGDPSTNPSEEELAIEKLISLYVGESYTMTPLVELTSPNSNELVDTTLNASGDELTLKGKKAGSGTLTLNDTNGNTYDIELRVIEAGILSIEGLQLKFVNQFTPYFQSELPKMYTYYNVLHSGVQYFQYYLPHSDELKDGFYPLGHYYTLHSSLHTDLENDYTVVVRTEQGRENLLAKPVDYTILWRSDRSMGDSNGVLAIWRPVPPPGYVAMGVVFAPDRVKPSLDLIRTVKRELTTYSDNVSNKWNDHHSGASQDRVIWRIENPNTVNEGYFTISPRLATSVAGHDVLPQNQLEMNVFHFKVPVVSRSQQQGEPKLTSTSQPTGNQRVYKVTGETVLLPFFNVRDDGRTLSWRIKNSPMYRVTREDVFHMRSFFYNAGNTNVERSVTTKVGSSQSDTTAMKNTAGISISTEFGIKAIGTTNKVSIDYSFEYSTSTTLASFEEKTTTEKFSIEPGVASAYWQGSVSYVAQRYDTATSSWINLGNPLSIELDTFVKTDYPSL